MGQFKDIVTLRIPICIPRMVYFRDLFEPCVGPYMESFIKRVRHPFKETRVLSSLNGEHVQCTYLGVVLQVKTSPKWMLYCLL